MLTRLQRLWSLGLVITARRPRASGLPARPKGALPQALGPGDRPAQVLKPTQRGEGQWDVTPTSSPVPYSKLSAPPCSLPLPSHRPGACHLPTPREEGRRTAEQEAPWGVAARGRERRVPTVPGCEILIS